MRGDRVEVAQGQAPAILDVHAERIAEAPGKRHQPAGMGEAELESVGLAVFDDQGLSEGRVGEFERRRIAAQQVCERKPKESVSGDENTAAVIKNRTADMPTASAMLLDPARCIRCGLCAARCPTEAVKMETFRFTEEVQFGESV